MLDILGPDVPVQNSPKVPKVGRWSHGFRSSRGLLAILRSHSTPVYMVFIKEIQVEFGD